MYKIPKFERTSVNINNSVEGDTIETKIEKMVHNKEPMTDSAPLIYTERKEGVQAGYNIRTDRFEIAIEAMDKVTASQVAKRENNPKVIDLNPDSGKDGGAEPTVIQ